ncbi:MAG: RICIN domain-containing protein [Bacteroidales bacterium]|nr:RICIN domain-containing protein [Bacteroidales bacterium]
MKKQRITRVMQAVLTTILMCAGFAVTPTTNAAVPYPNNLYLTQQTDYTCTLVSNAMMLRARMYLSNNYNWTAITESSLAPYGWINGAGQRSSYSCSFAGCSFTINQAYVNGLTVSQLQSILAAHPEGVCIYVTSIPHAQWVTDIENGVVYSGDSSCPAYFGRRPLANTYQGQCYGYNQASVLSHVTSYWYVSSYNVTPNINYNTTVTNSSANKSDLPQGTYRIACFGNSKYGIDVSGGSSADEANVQVWEYTGVKQQQFKMIYKDGHYNIQAIHSGKNLDLYKARSEAGTNVMQYTPDGTAVQNWNLQDAGDGAYYIVNSNGLYLDVNGGTIANGTNIQGWTGNKTDAQKWVFIAVDGKQSIPDGDYQIRNARDFKFGVDVSGVSTESGANVHLWTIGTGDNQKWSVNYLGEGYYKICAKHTGMALNVHGGDYKGYPSVEQYPFRDGDAASMWMLKDAGNGSFYVVNKNGRFLDVSGGKFADGTNIGGWTGNSTDAQKWKFVAVNGAQTIEDGIYQIRNAANTNFGLDVEHVSTEKGANVHLWTIGTGNNQKWNVKHLGNGYYAITALHSGKALDVNGAEINNSTNVQQWDNNAANNDAQQWIIKDAGNGAYYIINKKGLFLDVNGGTFADGTNVQGYVGNRSDAQKWVFKKIETSAPVITDAKVTNITSSGYTVSCTVSDSNGIKSVKMPTWTEANGQDDIIWHEATINGNTATYTVKVSDHKNERGVYNTHIYAYNNLDVRASITVEPITVPAPVTDTEAPVISDIKITDISQSGYKVTCTVNDNVGVKSVKMPTWTEANGQDDIIWHEATINGNTATFNVKTSDHKNEFGYYITHIYAYDEANNKSSKDAGKVDVPVLNGTYRIACASNSAIGLDVAGANTSNGANVELWAYDNAPHQQFTLTLQNDGYYTLKAVHSGKVLDVYNGVAANGTNVQTWDWNNVADSEWKIVHNSDGSYTFLSKLNNGYALDANGGTIANGTNIQLWESNNTAAQKWIIIPANNSTSGTGSGDGYNSYRGGRGGTGNILAYGVDVSEHQGMGYNFQALKNAGYSYVILRCGFITRKDYRFEEYYTAAKAAGLNVGAYFYSYAENASEARAEADKCLSYIAGKKFEYPIYFDFEDPRQYGDDAKGICLTFLDRVASQGYLVGLYGYASWLDEDYNGWVPTAQICQKYECWIANYPYANYVDNYTQKYKTRYGMFQFTDGQTSAGLAAGAGVDTDICFKDYPSIVKQYGFNGYSASKAPVVYNNGENVIVPDEVVTDLTDVTTKTVEKVQYYNMNGIVSDEPFEGINVIVTIYSDGSKDVKKVVK